MPDTINLLLRSAVIMLEVVSKTAVQCISVACDVSMHNVVSAPFRPRFSLGCDLLQLYHHFLDLYYTVQKVLNFFGTFNGFVVNQVLLDWCLLFIYTCLYLRTCDGRRTVANA